MGRDMMRLRRGVLLNTPHLETASGAVASFQTDVPKLKSAVVEFEASQDLHGYENPWPPGGGKNLVDTSALLNATGSSRYNKYGWKNVLKNNTTYTYSVYGNNQTYGFRLMAGHTMTAVPQPNIGISSAYVKAGNKETFTTPADIEDWEYLFLGGSGNGAADEDYLFQIELGSVNSPTYAPYSNVCPISGWSEAKVYDDPKYARTIWWNQLADSEARSGDHFAEEWASTIFGSNGTLVVTTTRDYTQFGFDFVDRSVLIQNGHKYFVSAELKTCSFVPDRVQFVLATRWNQMGSLIMSYDGLGTYAGFITATGDGVAGDPQRLLLRLTGTSVIGDNATYYGCTWIDLTAMFGAGNEPSTVEEFKTLFPNDYYAYNAGEETLVSAVNGDPYQVVIISLDGTRYGGTVDVLTGVLTVDRAEVDLGTLTWSKYTVAQGTLFRASISDSVSVSSTVAANAICSAYPVVAQTSRAEKTLSANLKNYDIINSDYSTAADFKTAMSGVQLVYELAEPFTVQLSPTQLRALKGQNNIFADCGDVAVDFWKHGG